MRHQIRTLQVPTQWGTGAFVSIPAQSSTASFNGQNIVTGAPGTVPVPSPKPSALDDSSLGGPYNQPSSVSPDWFLPSIYVAHANKSMRFPGNIARRNVSPVPATAIGATPQTAWGKPRIGGTKVTRSVRPFTQWIPYGKGASN
jgi:hypothetical protein